MICVLIWSIAGLVSIIGACLAGFKHEKLGCQLIGISCITFLIGCIVYGVEVMK